MNHRRITRFVFSTVSVLVASAMLMTLVIASSQIDIQGLAGSGLFGNSVAVLPNGNLVICDPGYDAGSTVDVGAAFLYDGADGTLISMLTGSMPRDRICSFGVTTLANGNYLVSSPHWDNGAAADAGAVTLGDGETGVSGTVSAANSLVGSTAYDHIGANIGQACDRGGCEDVLVNGVTVLANGNYLVVSPQWDNGAASDAGAVTWGDGETGLSDTVSAANSLVGSSAGDQVGRSSYGTIAVTALTNGNYLVTSLYWDNGAGAVTWGNGTTGITGPVSPSNSLVGSTAGDQVGSWMTALSNENYVVISPYWGNRAGAVTWGDGNTGVTGPVSAANSLVGSSPGDQVGYFGVIELTNRNYVVSSPDWDNGAVTDAGAVTWGDGRTGTSGPVSPANSLVGSKMGDRIGNYGVTPLSNGNYVVRSSYWDNGSAVDAGAVTWGNGAKGTTGTVSPANSLVGGNDGEEIGYLHVTALANGNYVVISPYWDNGVFADAGAVTWGDGTTGITGTISSANSLVGSSPGDNIGWNSIVGPSIYTLANGNYVVASPDWDNGTVTDAGAVTWGNGATGIVGPVSAANSLVGSTTSDRIGRFGATELANGNYLVRSPDWDNGAAANAGAVTWGNGTNGIAGPISAANSLVGSSPGDLVYSGVVELANGNYLVRSPYWDNGAAADAGAVTWVNGATGFTGPVSAANSLVGSSPGDHVGDWGGELANGNYVVGSPDWDNGAVTDAGAVTWADGRTGVNGTVSPANSLVGSSAGDMVGLYGARGLANGNYVVASPDWDNGAVTDAGAVTWADGRTGVNGTVSPANSLVGSSTGDQIGSLYMTELANGNYVVSSPDWDNGAVADAGAVTWVNGMTGITGPISAANSLVGSSPEDQVGSQIYYPYSSGVTELANGNYLVSSPHWDNGALADAGAITWVDGKTGVSGSVSAANSLVGSTTGDHIGFEVDNQGELINSVSVLSNGNYVVLSPDWDNGVAADAGAVTWGNGATGTRGPITAENSVRGEATDGGSHMSYKYDPYNEQLVVSRPSENIVTLFRPNRAPVAEAGWPLIVTHGALVRLDGSASYDPDGNLPLQFSWTQTGGSPVVLSDSHAISPTFTAPDERTSLTFTLVVTDALGSSSQPARAIVFVDPYQYFLPLTPEH